MNRFQMIKIWIQGFRLRTLPLALSSTTLGSLLALSANRFSWAVLILASSTTLFLQILSNLANDYGDSKNGVDDERRIGPVRITHTGLVTHEQIRTMIVVFVVLSLISGSLLVFFGLQGIGLATVMIFGLLGISAVYAAIKYTIGKNPYGYRGLGDIFVFIYFGIVGVAGTYYLHTHQLRPSILLPAAAIGLLATGVLNLNNLRDIASDTDTGKKTMVVRLGLQKAKIYHVLLLVFSMFFSLIYTIFNYTSVYQWVYIITFLLFYLNLRAVLENTVPIELNAELKKLALSTLIFSIIFGFGQII